MERWSRHSFFFWMVTLVRRRPSEYAIRHISIAVPGQDPADSRKTTDSPERLKAGIFSHMGPVPIIPFAVAKLFLKYPATEDPVTIIKVES
jgi:hypothetical protein